MIVKAVGVICGWMMNKPALERIHRFASADAVADAVASFVCTAAEHAIEQRGVFHWSLAGGTTPKQCYERLRDAAMDWQNVHVWFGDERCLPVGDGERNDVMADAALLQHVAIPECQIHRIPAELGAEQAAALYAHELASIECLDVALLGMGEDGHTASLFPHNPALQLHDLAVPVSDAPKAPAHRVSMGYAALQAARQRVMMITGEGKRHAFEQVCSGADLPVNIPDSDWYTSLS